MSHRPITAPPRESAPASWLARLAEEEQRRGIRLQKYFDNNKEAMMSEEPIVFQCTTGFGHRTQKPFVAITVGAKDFHTQMSPEGAIDLAHNLLACAEAAQTDAFLIGFFRKAVGADEAAVVGLLQEFRQWREAQGGQP